MASAQKSRRTDLVAATRTNANLKPYDFTLISRGIHLPLNLCPALGVKGVRLLETACSTIEQRQMDGLADLLRRSELSLVNAGVDKLVHISHAHMWDEVQLQFRSTSSFRNARKRLKAVQHQTLVQRGVYSVLLNNGDHEYDFQEC